jgi:N-acetylglucosamine-6-phosphate deacetylase
MTTLEGQIWTLEGWQPGRLSFGQQITGLNPLSAAQNGRAPERYLVPGLIDVHVHGGGGHDAMDGEDGVRGLARFHARHGTTALLATTITNPWPKLLTALASIERVMQRPEPGEACVLGAHLEGPFVNPLKLGAQPPFTVLPTPQLLAEVLAPGVVRVVTLAPELPGALEAAQSFAQAGVRVSLGHTIASAEQAGAVIGAVLAAGSEVSGTHLYNAMTGLTGREPGVVGALLAEPRAHAEVILDGHHVHRASFLTALRAKPGRLMLITDAMRAAGMPDGEYDLGGQRATVQGGQARLAGGSLAGSLLTLDAALRQAVSAGVPLHGAVALASLHPARYLGLQDRGRLEPGMRADVLMLSPELDVEGVYIGGEQIL